MHHLTNKFLLLSLGLILFSISFFIKDYLPSIILIQIILAFLLYAAFLFEKKTVLHHSNEENRYIENRHCEQSKTAWQSSKFQIISFIIIKLTFISFFIIDYLFCFTAGHYQLDCRKDFLELIDYSNIFQNEIIIIIQIISLSIILYFQNRLSFFVNRSAEIYAKFTLDTMPIACMGIDADYNSGLINLEEANIKRNKLRSVSDFLSNMDSIGKLINFKITINIVFCCFYLILGTFIGIYVNNELIVNALNISFSSSLIFTLYFIITSGFMTFINRISVINELKLIPDIYKAMGNDDNTQDKIKKLGYNLLKDYVLKQNDYFTKSDILRDCPSLEPLSLYSLIRELKREGIIVEVMFRKTDINK